MTKIPHVHATIIKAWADGAVIQYQDKDNCWILVGHPSWSCDLNYRIKPEPKPDIIRYARARCRLYDLKDLADIVDNQQQTKTYWSISKNAGDNLKAVFDGETGEFKSVEKV